MEKRRLLAVSHKVVFDAREGGVMRISPGTAHHWLTWRIHKQDLYLIPPADIYICEEIPNDQQEESIRNLIQRYPRDVIRQCKCGINLLRILELID